MKVKWILDNQIKCNQICINAKREFDIKYSSKTNYKKLIDLYNVVKKK